MEHFFDLPVTYKGEEFNLKARLVTFGYSYKFFVIIHGAEFVFEKDDDQKFRVLAESDTNRSLVTADFLNVVIETLDSLYQQ